MKDDIKKTVREKYGKIVRQDSGSCCQPSSCCDKTATESASRKIGYTETDIQTVPEGADLGLGCGNPVALASLKPGETVLDLGSGAGFDCFLAAKRVLPGGKVIGLDMTPEMIDKARENAKKVNQKNVEFLLGEIEDIPLPDSSVDVIISNCVINLSPDKAKVFNEALRVLKRGGRLMVSDIVLTQEIPEAVRNSVAAYVGCIAGALLKDQYLSLIEDTGFENVEILSETPFLVESRSDDPTAKAIIKDSNISKGELESINDTVLSISVTGRKP